MNTTVSIELIQHMNYPDFVAFLGQKNTPPGGKLSLLSWIKLANISGQSKVLDLACSNGFSSREIASITGCQGQGIDLSKLAISAAKEEAAKVGLDKLLKYHVGDAANLPFEDNIFSHILGGCNFSFILDRYKSLSECHRTLIPNGKLCVANFFYTQTPSNALLDAVKDSIGFRPEPIWDYNWWNAFFSTYFSLYAEEIYDLPVANEKKLENDIETFIYNKSPCVSNMSEEVKKVCFEKLFNIRKILNEHRKYQKFSVTIWNKNG